MFFSTRRHTRPNSHGASSDERVDETAFVHAFLAKSSDTSSAGLRNRTKDPFKPLTPLAGTADFYLAYCEIISPLGRRSASHSLHAKVGTCDKEVRSRSSGRPAKDEAFAIFGTVEKCDATVEILLIEGN